MLFASDAAQVVPGAHHLAAFRRDGLPVRRLARGARRQRFNFRQCRCLDFQVLVTLSRLGCAIQGDGLVGLVGGAVKFVPQLARCATGVGVELFPFGLQGLHFRAQHVNVEFEFGQFLRA